MKAARHAKILALVEERKFVSLHDLMSLTDSSESTIRADLIELSDTGLIIRLRGGAQAKGNGLSDELSVEDKMEIEVEAKKAIAEYASGLIKDGSVVYVPEE